MMGWTAKNDKNVQLSTLWHRSRRACLYGPKGSNLKTKTNTL